MKKTEIKNKLIIYQLPLGYRVVSLFSALFFLWLTIIALLMYSKNIKEIIETCLILIAMIVYTIYIYFLVFKTYICLDLKKGKLIIREFPGIKKEEIDIIYIKEIKYSDGTPSKYKVFFTLDIICNGFIHKECSWSHGPSGKIVMFNSYKIQKKRLIKFASMCNELLNKNGLNA